MMFRDGLNGFASLRTRPNVPVDPVLLAGPRYCPVCGARLRASNPGPTCARVECTGISVAPLTDAELVFIEATPRGAEVVAGLRGYRVSEEAHNAKSGRNEVIRVWAAQGMTQAAIGKVLGISQQTVCGIIRGK